MAAAPSASVRTLRGCREVEAADMRRALSATPPDFVTLVSLAQRAGALVLGVKEERAHRTPLHVAAMHGKPAYCALLIARGADVEARDLSGWTPLMTAVFGAPHSDGRNISVLRLLIAHNATANARCDHLSTPLMFSAAFGTTTMCQILLDAGAEINVVDRLGETALHKAALRGDMAIARFLVELGADTHIATSDGFTAADLAQQEGSLAHTQIAGYLRSLP